MPWQEDTILPATVSRQDEQVSGLKRSDSKIRKKTRERATEILNIIYLNKPKTRIDKLNGRQKVYFQRQQTNPCLTSKLFPLILRKS